MSIYTIEPLKCTPEFYNELVKIFQNKAVTPDTSLAQVMYQAGQQAVLEYIRGTVQAGTLSSDKAKTIKPASFVNRTISSMLGKTNGDTTSSS